MAFKNHELSILYEKLNEAKKKLETSKLALKNSKTDFFEKTISKPSPTKKRFSLRKNIDFLEEKEIPNQIVMCRTK